MEAIWQATNGQLIWFNVEVNGPEVSIRAKAEAEEQREHLRSMVASLNGLDGYRTALVIDGFIYR
jgi:hypothetical protein